MPYRKSTSKKTYKKRTYKPKAKSSFAARVKAVVKKESETKYLITNTTESTAYGTTLTSPLNYSNLNQIAEGFTENTRVGNKCNPFLINIRGSIQSNTLKPVITKLYLIESNIANDPRSDLLENNAGQFSPATTDLQAIYARVNTRKYRVLKTLTIKTGTTSAHAGDYTSAKLFNMTCKLSGTYEYLDGSSLCQKRNLMLVPIFRELQNDTSSGEQVEITWNSKLYYKDN